MKYLFTFLISMLIASCATNGQLPASEQQSKFIELYNNPDRCFAAYQYENLLVYVDNRRARHSTRSSIVVYNPEYGAFFYGRFWELECSNLNPSSYGKKTAHRPRAEIYFTYSPQFKEALDNGLNDPESLVEVIDSPTSSYLRFNGKWKDERSTIAGLETNGFQQKRLELEATYFHDAIDEFLNLPPSLLAENRTRITRDRVNKQLEQEREAEKRRQREQRTIDNWSNSQSLKLSKGDRACTFDSNHFGYVEELSGNRIKVFVVGRAEGSARFFYDPNTSNARFRFTKIESYRWFDRQELGHCSFNVN